MTRLTAPNGAPVDVDASKVDRLVRHGFKRVESEAPPVKKAASSSKRSK